MSSEKQNQKKKNTLKAGLDFSILLVFLSLGASISLFVGVADIILQKYHRYGLMHIASGTIVDYLFVGIPLSVGLYLFLYFIPFEIIRRGPGQLVYSAIVSLFVRLMPLYITK